jgi:hypothetical protein
LKILLLDPVAQVQVAEVHLRPVQVMHLHPVVHYPHLRPVQAHFRPVQAYLLRQVLLHFQVQVLHLQVHYLLHQVQVQVR